MSEIKLLPCPVCGGETMFSDSMEDRLAEVHCAECGARIDVKGYPALSKAIEKWNTRKQMERIIEKLEGKSRFYNSASAVDQNIRRGVKE